MANSEDRQSLDAIQSDRSFFGHPRGLATLFFTEMWERFSYYGMRGNLILYMVAKVGKGGLGFDDAKAGSVYGLYVSMVYLLCLGGGWIADRVTGQRRAVLLGGIFIVAGEFSLVLPGEIFFYGGLVFLMLGTGLLKGNVSTIVGQLYAKSDIRRDSGFSIFYMGINTGALISPLICGWVGENINWRWGFGLAGLGMVVGLVQYVFGGKHLGVVGLHPASKGRPELDRRQRNDALLAVGGAVGVVGLLGLLSVTGIVPITVVQVGDALGWILLAIATVVFSWLLGGKGWSSEERKRSAAVLVLFVASALFWASYEQAGSTLSLFAERYTNRALPFPKPFNMFPATWFQSVQPAFVVLFAPVFAWIWLALAKRKKEPSSPAKFAMGLLFAGLAFLILVPPASQVAFGVQAGMGWLTTTYLLQTFGELCLSPIGLSATSKLAPDRAAGFMMGIWFLSIAVGNWLAGNAVSVAAKMSMPTLFAAVAGFSIAAAAVLALLIKPTIRLMSGVK